MSDIEDDMTFASRQFNAALDDLMRALGEWQYEPPPVAETPPPRRYKGHHRRPSLFTDGRHHAQ